MLHGLQINAPHQLMRSIDLLIDGLLQLSDGDMDVYTYLSAYMLQETESSMAGKSADINSVCLAHMGGNVI